MKNEDHIVNEVRRARQEILESYALDWKAYMRDCMERQWQSGHKVASPPPKHPQQGAAPNAYPLRGKA